MDIVQSEHLQLNGHTVEKSTHLSRHCGHPDPPLEISQVEL
jgi:hypothetical protein